MNKILDICNLTIELNKTLILDNINLQAYEGEIIGIIGRNGSGKSVLFKAIAGFYPPKRGFVNISGIDIYKKKTFPPNFGALIENPGFLPGKSAYENLVFLASLQKKINRDDIISTLERLGLKHALHTRVRNFSLGMKQRLGIAQAIMEKPRLSLLYEPTNGLDKEVAKEVRILLKELKDDGVTILITSHLSDEIEELSSRIYKIENRNLREYNEIFN